VTKHGQTAIVVVSSEEWERKSRRNGTLAGFFAASPLRDSGLDFSRNNDGSREIDL
jgi:hypothetical protein